MATNLKYYAPMLLVAFSVAMMYGGFTSRRLLVICPALVAAFFFLSLANLEVGEGILRYRRFLKWRPIETSDVRGCGVSWPGVIGYIRLRPYVVPWGKLYFILDQLPLSGANSGLLAYLDCTKNSEDHNPALSTKKLASNFRLYLAAAIGILIGLMAFYLIPQNSLQDGLPKSTTAMPTLLKILFQLAEWLRTSAVQIIGTAVMALLAVSRRNKPEAWLYAFLSGFALAAIVVRLLS